jgi:hypothetical protein
MIEIIQPMPRITGLTTTHTTIAVSVPIMIATTFANPLIMR